MIQIDFLSFFCYYFIGAVCLYFVGGLLSGAHRWERVKGPSRQVWQCAVCLHTYFDPKPLRITACPVCGTYNKREAKEGESA